MGITRYIIWTTKMEDTNLVMKLLKKDSTLMVSITEVIVCVETELTNGEIRTLVGDAMEIACVVITDKFIKKLIATQFEEQERKNFKRFLSLTKVPITIDEGLDLINEKGGFDMLSAREKEALDKLTNKRNQ